MPVTIHVTLDARPHRLRKDGTYPVVLRVRKGTYRDYPVVYGHQAATMTPEQWERTQTERPREPWSAWKRRFAAIEQAARVPCTPPGTPR